MTATVSRPTRTTTPRPVPAPVADPQVGDLLDRCRAGLLAAANATSAGDRFATAHLAALRAAAAMLAARPLPARRTRLRSVWDLVPLVAPELAEWCQFFATTARRRAAVERGSAQVSAREADDLVRQVGLFLDDVTARLGLPPVTSAPPLLRPVVG